ncbi:MAG TPA: hypothetical protein VFO52_09065 [Longimicrobiales bacterium]|nr:hypothetical protein [Longimicrobiales bacterium]
MNKAIVLTLALVGVGCASTPQATQAQSTAAAQDSAQAQVPAGLGTLKQDEFTMGLRSQNLLVKVTPLHESVIRLAAPDTYNRLHSLRDSRVADARARSNSESPELFLVSFFSYQPDVTFQPEDVQIEHQGRLLRAATILPLTPTWGKGRLNQQEIATAVYVFADAFNYELPIVVRYGMEENNDWQRIIPKLQVERGKVTGRAKN